MTVNINENELKLLAYLHEHTKGYGSGFLFRAESVGTAIEKSSEEMSKIVSFLTEWGLIGSRTEYRRQQDGVMIYRELYLTALGESFVREVEDSPGVCRKITATVVSEMWGVLKSVAGKALSDLLSNRI